MGIIENVDDKIINTPITFNKNGFIALANDVGTGAFSLGIKVESNNKIHVFKRHESDSDVVYFWYLIIGD